MLRISVEINSGKECIQGKSPAFRKQILTSHGKYECILTGMCLWVLLERAGIELKTGLQQVE